MNETKNIMQIGSVMLTQDCIDSLKSLQEDGNDCIDAYEKSIMTAIMLLTIPEVDLGSKTEGKKQKTAIELSGILEDLENLRAPENKRSS